MRKENFIFAIALLAFAGMIILFAPTEARDTQSASSSFNSVIHLDSLSDHDSNVTWDTVGMKTNERQIRLRIPVDYNRYVFYASIAELDSGFAYVLDTDSGQVDLWFETSRDGKNWAQVAQLTIVDKATAYSDVCFVKVGDGANDTLYHRNWRVIQRILTVTIGDQFPTDFYDTVTTAFSIEGRNVF